MAKASNARKLLKRTAALATLVVVGVAETACNLQVSNYEPRDAGRDGGASPDAGTDAGTGADAAPDGSTP
ncbi:MAG: hypothetical protein U0234_16365 [Sandaracinus sp.]